MDTTQEAAQTAPTTSSPGGCAPADGSRTVKSKDFTYAAVIGMDAGARPVAIIARNIEDLRIAWDRITRDARAESLNEDIVQRVRVGPLSEND